MLRLIFGVFLALIGLSGFSMTWMMGWHMGAGMMLFPGYIVLGALLILGLYLVYDGLKE